MTRPLRIQYPDAWYHAMNRGRRGEAIFAKKEDHETFIHQNPIGHPIRGIFHTEKPLANFLKVLSQDACGEHHLLKYTEICSTCQTEE